MKNSRLKHIIQNEFFRNVITMLTGAGISQIITLAFIPILTRIYTPAQFGEVALYISIAHILSILSTGRYELAIMLSKKKENAYQLFRFIFLIIISFCILTWLILLIFKEQIIQILEIHIIDHLLLFLPFSVFLLGINKVFLQWQNRNKQFKNIAGNKIYQSAGSSASKFLGDTVFHMGAGGLFSGHIIGHALSNILYFKSIRKHNRELSKKPLNQSIIKEELKQNSNFPFYSLPMGVINMFSKDILIYALNIFYSSTFVGFYSNANKAISYPLHLLANAFKSVFYEKLASSNNKIKIYTYSYLINLLIGMIIMIPVIFWGKEIFTFILGDEWKKAGEIASVLAPLVIFNFPMQNVSNVFSVLRKNHIILIWQIIYLIISVLIIYLFNTYHLLVLLKYFAFSGATLYFFLAIAGFVILIKEKENYEE